MTAGRDDTMPVRSVDDVLACFDATCTDLFAVCCHLSAGDLEWADSLLAESYVTLLDAAASGIGAVDLGWLVGTACRAAVTNDPSMSGDDVAAHSPADPTLTERAAIELEAIDGPARDDLRRYERWLDDATRDRCRTTIRTGVRPKARLAGDSPGRALNGAVGPAPTARRLLLGIAAVLVAVIVAGLVALRAQDDVGRGTSAGAGSSRAVGTSQVRNTAEAGPVSTGYVIGDPPAGFRPAGAYEQRRSTTDGWFQLWAAPGTTRTSGEWLAIATIGDPVSGLFTLAGGRPIEIIGLPALAATDPDGVSQISMRLPGGGRFEVAGYALDEGQLHSIATDIALHDGLLSYNAASTLIDRNVELLVSTENPFGNLASQTHAGDTWSSSYQTSDLGRRISVTSRSTSPNDLLVAQYLLPASRDSLAPRSPGRTMQLADLTLTVSAEAGFDGKTTHTIQWHDGHNTVTLAGTADLGVLLAAVPSVRPATIDEWLTLSQLPPAYWPI